MRNFQVNYLFIANSGFIQTRSNQPVRIRDNRDPDYSPMIASRKDIDASFT